MLILLFYSLYYSMLDVDCFDFAYPESKFCYYRFYRSKTKRQDAKNKCCTLLLTGIYFQEKMPGSIFELFQIM